MANIPIVSDLLNVVLDTLIAAFRLLGSLINILPKEICILIVFFIVIFLIKIIPFVGD